MQRLPIEPISPGLGQPAHGPLRPHVRRHLHPALLRGRLRRPAGVHRPGDPAHQPRLGHPADDRARPRRHRARSRSSTRRTAAPSRDGVAPAARARRARPGADGPAQAAHPARPQARAAAGRPAAGPDGARGRHATAASARSWSSPPRCPSRTRASGRPTSSRPADAAARAASRDERSDFLAYLNLWSYLRSSRRSCRPAQFRRMCQHGVPALPAGPRVAGPVRPAARRSPSRWASHRRRASAAGDAEAGPHRRCWPACCRTSACKDAGQARVPRRPRRPVRDLPRLGAVQEAAALGDGRPSWSRRPGCGAASPRGSSRSGSSRWPSTWSSAATASRTGSKTQGAVMAYEKVTLYGVPIVAAAQGQLRPDRPGAVPRAVHPARAGRGRLAHPPPVLPRQPRAARRGRGAGAPGPPPRHPGRRRDAVRLLRRAGPGRTSSPARHFDAWWKKTRRDAARPARLRAGDAGQRDGRRGQRRPTTRTPGGRATLQLPLTLPVRAGRRRRRRDRPRPARRAQPGHGRAASTGRSRACARSW